MIVAPDKSWVYIGPPKTASTSLHSFLKRKMGGIDYNGNQHYATILPELDQARIFYTVRHPLTRSLSLWKHFLNEGHSGDFDDFLRMVEEGSLSPFYTTPISQWIGNRVRINGTPIRVERMFEDLETVFSKLPDSPVEHLNRTYHAPYPPRDLWNKIARIWHQDIDNWYA